MHHIDQLHKACRSEYEKEVEKLGSKTELDDWVRKLEYDIAELSDFEAQDYSAKRVLDCEQEFVRLVSFSSLTRLFNGQFTFLIGFPCRP